MNDGITRRHTVHTLVVAAPPAVVWGLVADVARWPVVFGPSLHVEVLADDGCHQRFALWALVNDEVASWTSRRTIDSRARCITFEQERSAAPVAAMGGEWRFDPAPGGGTEIVLTHHFAATGDDPGALELINAAVDRNSKAELDALRRIAEQDAHLPDLFLAFDDVVSLECTVASAYDFVAEADRWPQRLPHVGRVVLRRPRPGVQDLEMDTITPDGSAHTTRSIRLCTPGERIVYKQLARPALLLGHSGSWTFASDADGTAVVTSRHLVAIDPTAIPAVLGPEATLAEARSHVHAALSANSQATLRHAGAHGVGEPAP